MTYKGVDVGIHVFLTSALVAGEWSASRPGRFTPGTHWVRGWWDPRRLNAEQGNISCPYRDSNYDPSAVQPG
jgi:hypothetical protein